MNKNHCHLKRERERERQREKEKELVGSWKKIAKKGKKECYFRKHTVKGKKKGMQNKRIKYLEISLHFLTFQFAYCCVTES